MACAPLRCCLGERGSGLRPTGGVPLLPLPGASGSGARGKPRRACGCSTKPSSNRPRDDEEAVVGIGDNKALIRRFYAEIDAGNIDAMDELVAEDYVDHHPPPFPGLPTGREGLKEAFRIFWQATPGPARD